VQQAIDILEGRLFDEEPATGSRDIAPLLRLEAALHRREGLILVTSTDSRASSALVRSALENAGDATTAVTVSAENAEPFSAIDLLLEAASLDLAERDRATDKYSAALDVIGRAEMRGGSVVVVVDHADATSIAELERLRVALDVAPGDNRPVQLVLSGTRSFLSRLKAKDARGLWTRIGTRIDVPDGAAMKRAENGDEAETHAETKGEPQKTRRAAWITFAVAGALIATLLLAASLAGRGDSPRVRALATTVEPARTVGAGAPAAAAPPLAGPAAPSPATNTAGAAPAGTPPIAAAAPGTAPPMPGAVAPATPTSGPQPVGDAAGAARPGPATQGQGGPRVSTYMDVETVRGNARLDSKGAGPAPDPHASVSAQPVAPPPASAVAHPAVAAAAADSVVGAQSAAATSAGTPPSHAAQLPVGAPLDSKAAGPASMPRIKAIADPRAIPPSANPPAGSAQLAGSAAPAASPSGSATPPAQAPSGASSSSPSSQPSATAQGAQVVEVAPPPAAAITSKPAAAASPGASASAPAASAEKPATPAKAPAITTAAVKGPPGYDIQVGAFGKQVNAAALRDSLASEFPSARVEETTVAGAPFFRVRIGPLPDSAEATRVEHRLRELGHQPVRYPSQQPKG
jgi:cell division protein FtsN